MAMLMRLLVRLIMTMGKKMKGEHFFTTVQIQDLI
jgi:hypothetical protein